MLQDLDVAPHHVIAAIGEEVHKKACGVLGAVEDRAFAASVRRQHVAVSRRGGRP